MTTSITKVETGLPAIANSFVTALTGTKIKEASDVEILSMISACVEKAWFDLGLKPISDDDFDQLKINILAEVKACFTTLTLEEIKNAIHHGARGKYGEVFGISVIGVAKWLAAYMTDQSRVEARMELARKDEPTAEPPSEEEMQLARKNLIIKAFEDFKVNGKYPDYNNLIYSYLDKAGLICFTAERKKEFIQQAIKQIKESKNPLLGRNISERNALRKAQNDLIAKEADGTIKSDQLVISEAKRIALHTFFKEMVEMETEISDLFFDTDEREK